VPAGRRVDFDPHNHSEVVDFAAGDVWYFPRGYGHSIQGIGREDCRFILVFDNGHFSEFGTFSISDWLSHMPPGVLQKTLGVPAQRFANFPKNEVYISKGAVPPPLPPAPTSGTSETADANVPTHRFRLLEQKPEEYSGGTNRLASQREFPISTTMTGAHMRMKPGGIREPHWHPNADEWQYYLGGRASMSVFGSHGRVRTEQFGAGDVGYVPQGYGHHIEDTGTENLDVVVVFNNGMYESISLSAWLAANPPALLAANFAVSQDTFAGFPTGAVYIAR
jgi:oxalate decarboxylase